MLDWETWTNLHTENRVTLNDNLDMEGSYCFQISSDTVINSTWQSCVIANKNAPTASNFKIRALVRKNTNTGSLYLFGRANKSTGAAYILDIKDSIGLYKGVIGNAFSGSYLVNTGNYVFPKNVTYHIEVAFHTGSDNKTFIQVKLGDRQDQEGWTTIFSVVVSNEDLTSGYWGFGCGTYTRREQYYFDKIEYFVEY